MTIRQLMQVRRVVDRSTDNVVYTIRPWADNLNTGRCLHCCEHDYHAICPRGMLCSACASPMQRAQDDLM
eukprot:5419691-Heterocapsa_arctica.AAC.1